MNFKSCSYFLTVCEMGSIHSAARRLYISQPSLSQHIKKIEDELGVTLFLRTTPLTLTEEGKCFHRAARTIMDALDNLDHELAIYRGEEQPELNVGIVGDYGIIPGLTDVVDLFIQRHPKSQLQIDRVDAHNIPAHTHLVVSPFPFGGEYQSEAIIYDRLVVCVADRLLKKVYGREYPERKHRLVMGDFTAIAECPFIQPQDLHLRSLSDLALTGNGINPKFISFSGREDMMRQLCIDGKAALITLLGVAMLDKSLPTRYLVPNVPRLIPTAYICYHRNDDLPQLERYFLRMIRQYYSKRSRELNHLPENNLP